ncbi:hypothetical protein D3C79_959220 [compost metagenome]
MVLPVSRHHVFFVLQRPRFEHVISGIIINVKTARVILRHHDTQLRVRTGDVDRHISHVFPLENIVRGHFDALNELPIHVVENSPVEVTLSA